MWNQDGPTACQAGSKWAPGARQRCIFMLEGEFYERGRGWRWCDDGLSHAPRLSQPPRAGLN